MIINYDAIHAAARRERALAMDRFLFAPIAALFRRFAHPEARKPAGVFPIARSC